MTGIFPLGTTFLPGDQVVLRIFEERYLRMFDDMSARGEDIFVSVLIERGNEVGGGDRRFERGVAVTVDTLAQDEGQLLVMGTAGAPVMVTEWNVDDPYPSGSVEPLAWEAMDRAKRRDVASAISLLAQSVKVLLARHATSGDPLRHPLASSLATVASGQWHGAEPLQEELERAFWIVARCVPCGPLDRHRFLCEPTGTGSVRLLRSVIEHTDEILSFGSRDER